MIHNGADDNASGTAGVLELAQYFAKHPARHSMLFMAFSGEELGLLGSAHWVGEPTIDLARVRTMFNLDMIGRLEPDSRRLNVQGIGTSPAWKDLVQEHNDTEKFDLALIDDGHGSSDHSSFYSKDVPVLFFFTGLHTDYHRPSDDVEKINFTGQEEVVRYIAEIISAADARSDIPFTRVQKTAEQKVSRFNVYVGTIPDYAHTENGFRITGASPGSPAEKAGMKEGDILTRFGETEIRNIYDYMTALSRHNPGEEVPVVVRRGEETTTLTVKLVSK
jgi:Zn-dependent M28 family amino/carboxypeptidase